MCTNTCPASEFQNRFALDGRSRRPNDARAQASRCHAAGVDEGGASFGIAILKVV
jgi:hypothetical protein